MITARRTDKYTDIWTELDQYTPKHGFKGIKMSRLAHHINVW